ncbi:MAG: 2'-deoxycytidine 5'-triphosphate deaminase domain-containing protein, partial [Alphaproteobacteria bacterium]
MNDTAGAHSTGVLPDREIETLIATGAITAEGGIDTAQIQPASLDLRLGAMAYRVRSSFLPGPTRTVGDVVARLGMHEIPLAGGAVLER